MEAGGSSGITALSSVVTEETKESSHYFDISRWSFAHTSLNMTDVECILCRVLLVLGSFASAPALLAVCDA